MAPPKEKDWRNVESNPYIDNIHQMMDDGVKLTEISQWLKKNDAPLSRQTLSEYKNHKYKPERENAIREKYNEKLLTERKDKYVESKLQDLEVLDRIIELGKTIDLNPDKLRPEPELGVSQLDIEKHKINVMKVVMQATKLRADILGVDKPITNKGNTKIEQAIIISSDLPPQLRRDARDVLKRLRDGEVKPGDVRNDNEPGTMEIIPPP